MVFQFLKTSSSLKNSYMTLANTINKLTNSWLKSKDKHLQNC